MTDETNSAMTAVNESKPLNIQHLFEVALRDAPDKADAMAKLQEMYYRDQDRRAALEFNLSLAKFQDSCPPIPRTTHVSFVSRTGGKVDYRSADFEQIIETCKPHLRANGFSLTFDMDTKDGMVTATCTLRHVNGHSVMAKATIPWASNNPGMSEQQKFGSANTFAKRTALTSVLGLSLTDPEEEGADPTPISEEQANILDSIAQKAEFNTKAFFRWATGKEDGKYADILLSRFDEVKAALEKKVKEKEAKEKVEK